MVRFIAISDTNYQESKRRYPHTMATYIVNVRVPMLSKIVDLRREVDSLRKTSNTIVVLHAAR